MTGNLAFVGLDMDLADLVWSMADWRLVGLIDKDADAGRPELPHLGSDEEWPRIRSDFPQLRLCLTLDKPDLKVRVAERYGHHAFITLTAPEAYLAAGAAVGHGGIVQRQVTIMTGATAGVFCKFNIGATVHHDCRIGDFCTLAPGARLLGGVRVEDRVMIGSGAIVLPHVGVGAGAVVNRDVAPGATVAGVPARPLPSS